MPKQLLNDAQVSTIFQQMGCETMAQHVRGYVAVDPGAANSLFDSQPHGHSRKWCPTVAKEEISRRTRRDQFRPSTLKIVLKGGDCLASQGHDTFFVAFANNIYKAGFEV